MPWFSLEAGGFVAAPPEIVWSQLVDRESVSAWLDGIEPLSGAGERFSTRRASECCGGAIEGRVVQLEHERRLGLVLRGPWHLLREITLDIELAPADHGTSVVLRAVYRLRWLGWMLLPLLRLRAQIALHRASRGFRAAIDGTMAERRRAAGAPARDRRHGAARPQPDADPLLLRTIQG